MYSQTIRKFIEKEHLPETYFTDANKYFVPLLKLIITKASESDTPLVVGVSGAQGTGKTSLSELLNEMLAIEGFNVARFSIDDFYLTRKERARLAKRYHPLLRTRGVPGTHDTNLLSTTLGELTTQQRNTLIEIPSFDKASDDRLPREVWQKINAPTDLVLFEGWFVGATPMDSGSLQQPINELETTEDKDGSWRTFVTNQLKQNYQNIFDQIDILIFLRAPSFEQVFDWRGLQENKLRRKVNNSEDVMNDMQLIRFIQHYERLTRHCLKTLPNKANIVYGLNHEHRIISCSGLR